MSNIVRVHPVATTTLGASTVATAIIWAVNKFTVPLTAEEGAIITGLVGTMIAVIGHKGLIGIWENILHGNQAKGIR